MTIYAIRLYVSNLTMSHYGLAICVHICFVKKTSSSSKHADNVNFFISTFPEKQNFTCYHLPHTLAFVFGGIFVLCKHIHKMYFKGFDLHVP